MEKEKPKFNALTPEVLEEGNKSIYNEALDFAFSNKDIKNIAITGIYGSGKSTVWNTYVNKNDELKNKNIITVSLGKYEDNIEEIGIKLEDNKDKDNNSEDKYKDSETNYKDNEYEKIGEDILDNENRVERQIINQILSQVNAKDIPLSKYGFKSNKSRCIIIFQSLSILLFIFSVLFLVTRSELIKINSAFESTCLVSISILSLFLTSLYFFYTSLGKNKLQISKINFKGAEADLNNKDNNDETVLDRDIKELVYLIKSSKSKIIVFEDLDRYDNIAIYTKLRELNFLLNKFSKTNDSENEEIKFVYMIRDGIFKSKNRTKFFDYIIPIVPIVDSRNSENIIVNLLGDLESLIDKKLIFKISLYIDDMRLIKNIINEFIIYKDIIKMNELKLSYDKLFSLIVLKNIFPSEFDLLQEDRGYLFDVIYGVEYLKINERNNLKTKIEESQKKIESIIGDNEDEYKYYSADLNYLIEKEVLSLKLIKPNIQSFEKEVIIRNTLNEGLLNYLGKNYYNKICELLIDITINKNFINLDKELLLLASSEIDKVFRNISDCIANKKYLPLIKILIGQGYIDKTYWHYKGYFYKGSLGVNDIIFIKNINEAQVQDPFLELENPSEIINRLDKMDFSKFNILNKKLLECCINENRIEYILSIIRTVIENRNYKKLAEVLENYDYKVIERLISIILPDYKNCIVKILEVSKDCYSKVYNNILIAIYTNNKLDKNIIKYFNKYIEDRLEIAQLISEEKFHCFLENIIMSKVKFNILYKDIVDINRIKDIVRLNAYFLHVYNIKYILKKILGISVQYGNLLSEIYNSSLSQCKEYIESDFIGFIETYIIFNENKEVYINDENILIRILNSELFNNLKIDYLNLNKTKLSNIKDFKNAFENEEILDCMFDRDLILFNKDNVKIYYETVEKLSKKFIDYVERNLNESNVDEILKGNSDMCNEFINNPELSDNLFKYVYKYAKEPIKNLDSNLSKERINLLLGKELIAINYDNMEQMLGKFEEEIVTLVNSNEGDFQDSLINEMKEHDLEEELIYKLINSKISDENAMKLVDIIESGVLIEKINSDKENLISSIIDRELSNDNINYICNNFKEFKFQEKFISNLYNNQELYYLSNDNLNDDVMAFILNLKDLDVDIKTDLICKKIDNNTDFSLLKKYIESVPEISKLAGLWKNNYPKLISNSEKQVGNKLLEKGIVGRYGNKEPIKIFIPKDKKQKGKNGA